MPLDAAATDLHAVAARNPAMAVAEAMFAALGRADWLAGQMTIPFDPPLENLRRYLLFYAALTRDPMMRSHVPEYRERARNAVRAYRTMRGRK